MMKTAVLVDYPPPAPVAEKGILPILEANIREHAKLHAKTSHTDRKTKCEDCCRYCDLYFLSLSNCKHEDITRWAHRVNQELIRATMTTPGVLPAKTPHKSASYQPPGVPDDEPGFRRITTPRSCKDYKDASYLTSRTRSSVTNHSNMSALSSKMAELDLYYNYERKKSRERVERQMKAFINGNNKLILDDSTNDSARSDAKETQDSANSEHGSEQKSVTSSESDSDSTMCMRTSSNRLLNVVSIDDYMMRNMHSKHSRSNSSISPPSIDDIVHRSNLSSAATVPRHRDGSSQSYRSRGRINSGQRPMTLTASSPHTYATRPSSYASSDMSLPLPPQNDAALRALDAIINTREVMHSQAHKGLYRYEKSCQETINFKPESRRFKKLNQNLHKWIDKELLKPGRRLQQRLNGEAAAQDRHNHRPWSRNFPQPNNSAINGQSDGRGDNFLEMLMEMDENDDTARQPTHQKPNGQPL